MAQSTIQIPSVEQYTIQSSDYANLSGATVVLERQDNIVSVRFQTIGTITASGDSWVTLFTVPTRFRPANNQKMLGMVENGSDYTPYEIRMATSGEFQVYAPTKGHKLWGGSFFYMIVN